MVLGCCGTVTAVLLLLQGCWASADGDVSGAMGSSMQDDGGFQSGGYVEYVLLEAAAVANVLQGCTLLGVTLATMLLWLMAGISFCVWKTFQVAWIAKLEIRGPSSASHQPDKSHGVAAPVVKPHDEGKVCRDEKVSGRQRASKVVPRKGQGGNSLDSSSKRVFVRAPAYGGSYHTPDCKLVLRSAKLLKPCSLSEVQGLGLTPCRVCVKPSAEERAADAEHRILSDAD